MDCPFDADGAERDRLGDEAVALLCEYLRVDTQNPPGGERAGAAFLADVLARDGIDASIAEAAPGRANLVARLRGTGARGALVLHHHIDVVPAEAHAWSADPFGGAVRDGYIVGRGALDMKSTGILHLVALLAIKRSGVPLDRDLVFLATADEETGSRHGARFVVDRQADWLAGVESVLTELGAIRVEPRYRAPFGSIAVAEKTQLHVRITARGRAGHACVPARAHAVNTLIVALARLLGADRPPRVVPLVAEYFRRLAEVLPEAERPGLHALGDALGDDAFRERFMNDPFHAALVSDTLAITILRGGGQLNIVPSEASAEIDCRCLPGQASELLRWIRALLADLPVEVGSPGDMRADAGVSDPETPLYAALARTLERRAPGVVVAPELLVARTDAAIFRAAGLQSYGFSPFILDAQELAGIHGVDERLSIANVKAGVMSYLDLLHDLAMPAVHPGALSAV